MKKLIAFLTIAGMFMFSVAVFAQDATEEGAEQVADTTVVDTTVVVAQPETPAQTIPDEPEKTQGFHQVLKEKFIEGDAMFMSFVLLALVFETGGIDAAREVCKDTRGPVASIFFQGLTRYDDGLAEVEKSIVAYGSVLMGRLESGLSWISLFIAVAPMLGFMGTVIGMISAFDNIEAVGDISPAVVAGGIKMALLTTVFGLIVAIILQIFYNYIISKVDSLVNAMEDSTISFIDILASNKK